MVEIFIHQLQENWRKQTFENKMRKWLIILEGLAQFHNLAGSKKRFIQKGAEFERPAADHDVILLKLAGSGQIALHHATIIPSKRLFRVTSNPTMTSSRVALMVSITLFP